MKVKARISTQECPQKYWLKTNKVEILDDIPEEIIEEIKKLMPDLKRGKAKNQTAKKKMIELYNTIHNTKYSVGTNCSSCIVTCYDGIKNIYDKYSV